jgi:Domain of unknown function (DUF4276)
MVAMKLFVEGGGDAKPLRTACREGFTEFLKKAGLRGYMPRVIVCGSRKNAYDDFCTALDSGEPAMLLVDSEERVDPELLLVDKEDVVTTARPWRHLLHRVGDKWDKPPKANDAHCHLMAQCMEAWFLTDRETLKNFFGQGFNVNALPAVANPIEEVAKLDIFQSLANATKGCKTKAPYGKGEHSFKLLALIDPAKVMKASGWAKHFVDEMKKQMGC